MKTKPTKIALILSGVLAILCFISILCLLLYPKLDKRYIAYIYVDGILYESIPLYEITTPYSFRICTETGAYNDIYVESGSICISSADCPDRVCVKQGAITNNLLPITCLPHHLVIALKPVNLPVNQPDAITH